MPRLGKRRQNNRNRIAPAPFDQVRSEGSTFSTKPRRTSPGAEEAHEEETFGGRHVPRGCIGLRKAML